MNLFAVISVIDGEVMTWWTVFALYGEPPAKACRSWMFAEDSKLEVDGLNIERRALKEEFEDYKRRIDQLQQELKD